MPTGSSRPSRKEGPKIILSQARNSGEAIGSFAKGLFAAYPNASFESISIGDTGRGLVAFQWLASGTNTGPGPDGTPPTGCSVRVPGGTFVQVDGDKIRSEHVYHDRRIMAEQLGARP